MYKKLIQYIFALIFLSLAGIISMDYFILPSYVGYNNEHYLPDIRGRNVQQAKYELVSLGFKTEFVYAPYSEDYDPGFIIKMFPRAFTKVKEGRTIKLTVAGLKQDIYMPNYVGMSLRNAKISINRLGFVVDTIIYEYDNNVKLDYITFQLPRAEKMIKSFTKVTLGASRGAPPDYYIVPDVLNLSIRKAKDKIIKSGLRIGDVTYEYQPKLLDNTVINQNMTAGMRVSFPAAINLIVSKEEEK